MTLLRVSARASESLIQQAQLLELVDLELFPRAGRATDAVAAALKHEQALDAVADPVVVRLGDAGLSDSVDEFD